MSISIYYCVRRQSPLTDEEHYRIEEVISKFPVDGQIEDYLRTNVGLNWESFCIYDSETPSMPDVIFEGATKLPDNSDDASWIGVQHWCNALTELHRILPGAVWNVSVDDHPIVWDSESQRFDPSK